MKSLQLQHWRSRNREYERKREAQSGRGAEREQLSGDGDGCTTVRTERDVMEGEYPPTVGLAPSLQPMPLHPCPFPSLLISPHLAQYLGFLTLFNFTEVLIAEKREKRVVLEAAEKTFLALSTIVYILGLSVLYKFLFIRDGLSPTPCNNGLPSPNTCLGT
jgi:hypothetical protein